MSQIRFIYFMLICLHMCPKDIMHNELCEIIKYKQALTWRGHALECVISNLLIGQISYYSHRTDRHTVDHLYVFLHVFCRRRKKNGKFK